MVPAPAVVGAADEVAVTGDGAGGPILPGPTIDPVHDDASGFDGIVSALLTVAPHVPQAFAQVTEMFKMDNFWYICLVITLHVEWILVALV